MDDMYFGQQLRSIRTEHGLTREELAERVGAGNAKTVWKYESGNTDPTVSTVRRFAAALRVSAAELLEEGQQ